MPRKKKTEQIEKAISSSVEEIQEKPKRGRRPKETANVKTENVTVELPKTQDEPQREQSIEKSKPKIIEDIPKPTKPELPFDEQSAKAMWRICRGRDPICFGPKETMPSKEEQAMFIEDGFQIYINGKFVEITEEDLKNIEEETEEKEEAEPVNEKEKSRKKAEEVPAETNKKTRKRRETKNA